MNQSYDFSHVHPVKFFCSSGEQLVPYLLFYTKDGTGLNDVPLITNEMYNLTEPVDFVVCDETSNAGPKKRTFESSMDDLDDDNLKSAKIRIVEENLDDDTRKFNFGKKKCKFSIKQTDNKLRGTVAGREKQREIDRRSKRKLRSTLEGQEKNKKTAREGMENIRSTPEGQEKNRNLSEEIRSTPEGRKKHNER